MILVNLSGRGDKDVATAARWFDLVEDDAIAETAPGPAGPPGGDEGSRAGSARLRAAELVRAAAFTLRR